jgi:hypothetical protein
VLLRTGRVCLRVSGLLLKQLNETVCTFYRDCQGLQRTSAGPRLQQYKLALGVRLNSHALYKGNHLSLLRGRPGDLAQAVYNLHGLGRGELKGELTSVLELQRKQVRFPIGIGDR